MKNFDIKTPAVKDPHEIEELSLKTILEEAGQYPGFSKFHPDEQKVVQRMIHTTTCFEQVIDNICFSSGATSRIKTLLEKGATIIADTNMIRSGLNKVYTEKYGNNTICYVSEPDVKEIAQKQGTTRTDIAVKKALTENKSSPLILACGNAPTFLYAAIELIVNEGFDLNNIAIIAMPVGFINVVESKDYTLEFMNMTGAEGIVLKGRYGGSPLVVAALHALYKLI